MRCKNCGWENTSESLKCAKCNAPLAGSMIEHTGGSAPKTADGVNLKGTIPEGQVFGGVNASNKDQSRINCPKCGYPIGRGMMVCPNCNAPISDNSGSAPRQENIPINGSTNKCGKCKGDIPAGAKFCPVCGAPIRPGTLNPWVTPQNGTFCSLMPLAWENESITYNPISFSGTNIVLNRANTDPNNQTITSAEQAELTFDDGAWYIRDRSVQQTTYIHAGHKTKLASGDIILLGNRRFEFKG